MKSKKKGLSPSFRLRVKASNLNHNGDASFNNQEAVFGQMLKNIETLYQLNEFLREEVIIFKGEKERLEIVVKEKDDVIIDLRKVKEMLVGIIKKKDEMIAKIDITLKEAE
ncbi:hypothetical protein PVK06_038962 [Gossypium arboreum]|uniref:Uncharacterized protein n=1 Tax=Gossypium arboreum TaxID=29729 RepID=A0ABR0N273_GOSAR|nr:hypothetical protein PVK06_038962 [Gossypium arboreum]